MKNNKILILMIMVIFLFVATGSIIASGLNLDISFLAEDNSSLKPVYGAGVWFSLERINFGADYYLKENDFQFLAIYSGGYLKQIFDLQPLFRVGYGQYNTLNPVEENRGLFLGVNLENHFKENFQAFTSVSAFFFPGKVIPVYETGFSYYILPNISAKLFYRGYDFDQGGLTLGISLNW